MFTFYICKIEFTNGKYSQFTNVKFFTKLNVKPTLPRPFSDTTPTYLRLARIFFRFYLCNRFKNRFV